MLLRPAPCRCALVLVGLVSVLGASCGSTDEPAADASIADGARSRDSGAGPDAADGGTSNEDAAVGDDAAAEADAGPLEVASDRVIVWQQNIEGMKAGAVGPAPIADAMLAYSRPPDIVILQEAWQKVLCGDYRDAAAIAGDEDANNWTESEQDANGLARTCRLGRDPLVGSVLHRIGSRVWGGVDHLDHRRPFSNRLGQHTATGTAIAWNSTRFMFEDDFEYQDEIVGCDTTLRAYRRIAVLLRDTRRTRTPDDDTLVAVASAHYGSVCPSTNNRWVAEEMVRRWASFDGLTLTRRFITGDFNLRVDETSTTYEQRRREETPRDWYRAVVANADWLGGRFRDAVKVRHGGGTGDSADICGQWSYPNVGVCEDRTACSARCTGYGIGGGLDRIDFVFVSNGSGTLDPSRIASAVTDENGETYSDHKGIRVSVLY